MMAAIKVRAKSPGFYRGKRKRAGAEFSVETAEELGKWMEVLEAEPAKPKKGPKSKATAKAASDEGAEESSIGEGADELL